jgi:hypothetical protein
LFVGTSQEPGIIPRAINVLFNSIRGKQSQTCRLKPEMVIRVVKLDDKAMHQEIAYKQQIMSWSQDKYHVSRMRTVKSAAHLACNKMNSSERVFAVKRLSNNAGFNLQHFYISKEIMLNFRFVFVHVLSSFTKVFKICLLFSMYLPASY